MQVQHKQEHQLPGYLLEIYERTKNTFENFGANNCPILPEASNEQGEENEEN